MRGRVPASSLLRRCLPAAIVLSSLVVGSAPASSAVGSGRATMRLCVSVPMGNPGLRDLSAGIYRATVLATDRAQSRLARAGVALAKPLRLDYGTPEGLGGPHEVHNAKTCLGRRDTFAYIGPVNSGVAVLSEPVLNRASIATISPSTTAPPLTDPQYRRNQEPLASRLGYVTFYRTVAPDSLQGPAAALFSRTHLHARTYFLIDDGQAYGEWLSGGMVRTAQSNGLQSVGVAHLDPSDPQRAQTSANAAADRAVSIAPDMVYCGCEFDAARVVAAALRERGYQGSFVGGDAIENPQWISAVTSTSAASSYATNPGLDSSRSARWFRQAYASKFRTPLQFYDAYAFDAATIALNALYAAATRHQLAGSIQQVRRAVVKLVAHTCYRGATGTTTFDRNGDTNHRVVGVYATHGSTWRFAAAVTVGKPPTCR